MDKYTGNLSWTVDSIKDALLDGKEPRDAGGEDARLNKPLPQAQYLPEYLRSVHMRGEALVHATTDWAEGEFSDLAAAVRSSPFALAGVEQKTSVAVQNAADTIDRRIAHESAALISLREHVAGVGTTYARDLQAADAKHPRRGWPDGVIAALIVLGIFLVEIAFSALWLRHAMGAVHAIATGVVFSFVSLGCGALSAWILLQPTNHTDDTFVRRVWRWTLAVSVAVVAFAVMYFGASYRAALIDGANGDYADIAAKLKEPAAVLFNFDVLTLFLLGLLTFGFAAYEVWIYYHGYRRLLRHSGVAKMLADKSLTEAATTLKDHVHHTTEEAEVNLADIDRANEEWVRSAAHHADAAAETVLEANRRIDLIRRICGTVAAEYRDGYHEVRPLSQFATWPDPAVGFDVEIPAVFAAARDAAIADARAASRVVQQARAEITRIANIAILRIDTLAGFNAFDTRGAPLLSDVRQ